MNDDRQRLVKLRLRQAREDLAISRRLCDGVTPPRIVVNRLYYACFCAVSAVLAAHDLNQSKHSGVRSQFFRHFVRPGAFATELGSFTVACSTRACKTIMRR